MTYKMEKMGRDMASHGPILLQGGRVIDPVAGTEIKADVLIQDGLVKALAPGQMCIRDRLRRCPQKREWCCW